MGWDGLTPPYATIVVDPPWPYPDAHRWPATSGDPGKWRSGVRRDSIGYSTMSLDAIISLDVEALAARACRLFLWTTSAFLFDSPALFTAWGFTYRQTLVWSKTGQLPPFGGSVAPNTAEFLLVATRGAPPVLQRAEGSLIEAPKPRTHSSKPQAFLDLVELVSPGPYAELFARAPRLGWDSWGNGYEGAA